uniref:Uncharacterized protein n=1 Tax=Arion vulgaris TaxID=1028688 RepID=A0A0B7BEK9_9EUPU
MEKTMNILLTPQHESISTMEVSANNKECCEDTCLLMSANMSPDDDDDEISCPRFSRQTVKFIINFILFHRSSKTNIAETN